MGSIKVGCGENINRVNKSQRWECPFSGFLHLIFMSFLLKNFILFAYLVYNTIQQHKT